MTFSYLCGYDHPPSPHLCDNCDYLVLQSYDAKTCRKVIVATRRGGVTTCVLAEIAPRGVHHMVAHARYQYDMFSTEKGIRAQGKTDILRNVRYRLRALVLIRYN